MREGLKQEVKNLLENYLADFEYWCGDMDINGVNFVTAGTPYFETLEDANAYRVMVKAVLKEFKDA